MKIFLSYAHADHELIEKIHGFLREKDYEVLIDKTAVKGGAKWQTEIERMVRAADVHIFLLTKNSLRKNSYVIREIEKSNTFTRGKRQVFIEAVFAGVPHNVQRDYLPREVHRLKWSRDMMSVAFKKELLEALGDRTLPGSKPKTQAQRLQDLDAKFSALSDDVKGLKEAIQALSAALTHPTHTRSQLSTAIVDALNHANNEKRRLSVDDLIEFLYLERLLSEEDLKLIGQPSRKNIDLYPA